MLSHVNFNDPPGMIFMTRFALFALICMTVLGSVAPVTPASADPHGDRMKRDCSSGARKC
jgi:hypothetical protein